MVSHELLYDTNEMKLTMRKNSGCRHPEIRDNRQLLYSKDRRHISAILNQEEIDSFGYRVLTAPFDAARARTYFGSCAQVFEKVYVSNFGFSNNGYHRICTSTKVGVVRT